MSHSSRIINVLVTRPDPAGTELCQHIEAQGDRAIYFPTIALASPPDLDDYKKSIAALGQQDWLIFISPQAVYTSIPAIRSAWPDFPPQTKFAAVGEGTANALRKAGYLVSVYPETTWNSESLLALPEFQAISGKKIAVIRGKDGREWLDKVLAERGAIVMPVIAYERVLPVIDTRPCLDLLKQNKIDTIICTSFTSVQNLKIMMAADGWKYLRSIPIIVVSERIKMLAQDLGFQTIWVARNASHAGLLAVLAQKKDKIWQIKQMKQ